MNGIYIAVSLLWLTLCAAIAWYIIGKGMSFNQQLKLGLKLIALSFLTGAGFLVFAITTFV